MKIPTKKLKEKLKNAYWVCHPCGKRYGRNPEKRTLSTFHEGICSICGETRAVTEIRDYGYAKEV